MSPNVNRRQFLKRTTQAALGALSFPYLVSSSALGNAGNVAASNRLTLGFIGVGGRGSSLLQNFINLPDSQIVAVCDVKKPIRDIAKKQVDEYYGKKVCDTYIDFRDLLARDDIDAVVIATQDHWHVLQSLAAIRRGKDVYCEKPLAVSMEQRRVLRDEVKRYGRVFQFGNQERSSRKSRFGCGLVLNGRIGRVHTIKVGTRESWATELFPPMPVPDWIDYDLWLGPAPWAPYNENRVIDLWWFHISDYTLGFIAGCGVHTLDLAQWGNGTDLTGPVEVEGTGVFPRDGLCDCAVSWNVNLKYANGVTMNFTDSKQNPLGVRFEGTDGWVFVKEEHLAGIIDAHPKSLLREGLKPDDIIPPSSNHHQKNFLDCVRSRQTPVDPIDIAVRSDTVCHLSDIAMRLDRKLNWDPVKEEFVNDDEANRMLNRPLRSPWHL